MNGCQVIVALMMMYRFKDTWPVRERTHKISPFSRNARPNIIVIIIKNRTYVTSNLHLQTWHTHMDYRKA